MDHVSAQAERHTPGGINPRIKVIQASLWAMLQNSAPKLVSFGAFLILASFLTPDEIGIAAAIAAILALAELICEQGFGDALVQRRQLTDADLNFAFWAVLGAGATAAVALLLSAHYLALLLRTPQLEP